MAQDVNNEIAQRRDVTFCPIFFFRQGGMKASKDEVKPVQRRRAYINGTAHAEINFDGTQNWPGESRSRKRFQRKRLQNTAAQNSTPS
jgi:hypothetical protein